LATKSGVSYRELAAIRRVLITENAAPVVGGSSLFDVVVATTSIVSVGCRALDNLLEGGILTGEITEVVSDRSAVSHTFLLNTIVTVVTTMSKNVVLIDISNRFDAGSFAGMLASQPNVDDVENALKRVRVVKCFDVLELFSKLSMLCEASSLSSDSFYSSVKLIVIDGIVDSILLSLGHMQNNAGCGYVAQIVHQLRLLTTDFCNAVLLCNSDGCMPLSKNASSTRPTPVGRLWCSVPDTRLDIVDITGENADNCVTDNRTKSRQLKVTVSKSSRLPVGPCVELKTNQLGLFA